MKPIAIFRFSPIEGPGYFATFLDNNHIPWQLISIDQGEGLPGNIHLFSGLVLMGGPMSANDNLPWIGSLLALIKQAVAHDVPVLGHCLGGQLMSKAFGGIIEANPIKELGWGKVRVADNPVAHEWLGDLKESEPFHWHGEAFSLPAGSALLLSNASFSSRASSTTVISSARSRYRRITSRRSLKSSAIRTRIILSPLPSCLNGNGSRFIGSQKKTQWARGLASNSSILLPGSPRSYGEIDYE